jgi:hypothetical protein
MLDQEDAAYAALDAAQPAQQLGYEDSPVGHSFASSQHERILEANNANPSEPSQFEKATAGLERATLKLRLSLDSAELMGKNAAAYSAQVSQHDTTGAMPDLAAFTAQRLQTQQQMSMANPEKAAAIAVVEANAPIGASEEFKTAAAFKEYQLGSMAKYVEDKAWVFSPDSYLSDFASMAINPVRTIVGQGRAGSALGVGKTGYYKLLNEWHSLSHAEQEQMWDPLLAKLKEASRSNDLVFMSLANPFIYEESVSEAYVDTIMDFIDTGSTIAALSLAYKARSALSYSRRALNAGNAAEAGKANASAIAKGDPAAIVEGQPIPHPLGTPGLSVPTQLHIEEVARAQGRLADGESIVTSAPPLNPSQINTATDARKAAVVANGGKIVSTDAGVKGVEITFTVEKPGLTYTINDLGKSQSWFAGQIEGLVNDRKLLVMGGDAGGNADEVKRLTDEIDMLRSRKAKVDEALVAGAKTVEIDGKPKEVLKKEFFAFTENDVGLLEMKDNNIGLYTHIVGTHETRVGKLIDGLVSMGTNMRQQQRRLFGYFDKDIRKLRKQLRRTGKEAGPEVDALLLTGDRLQKFYTTEELKAGVSVDGIGLVTFKDSQIDAYTRVRKGYDDLYILANRMQADELTFGGYEAFAAKYTDGASASKDIQVFAKTNAIEYVKPRIKAAMDLRASSATKGNPLSLDSVSDLGDGLNKHKYGFVKMRTPLEQGDGAKYTYALVDVDDFGDFSKVRGANKIDQVLDYRTGYVPKMAYENIRWIVEAPKLTKIDGVEISDTRILRGFETESEAKIYVDQLKSKDPDSKAYHQEVNTKWRSNSANKEKSEFLDNRLFRGAFVGHRFDNAKFRVGLDGHEATRVSSFDALQRYADYVAAYAPMHEFKQAMISQFLSTAKNNDGSSMLAIRGRWDSQLSGSGDAYLKVKAVQDWMKTVFAVPTTEEQYFTKITDRLLKTLERAIYDVPKGVQRPRTDALKGLHHWIGTSKSASDPVSYMKGITFDLMLGAFNPAQYFVQSAGVFIPATLKPLQSITAIPEFMFIRTAMHSKDYKAVAAASKSMGYNPKKMYAMLHAWHRSGIPDSILENADFGHYAGTQGAYYSPSMMNRVRDKSRMFYNAGELNNRLFSFTVAFNEQAKKNKWDLTKTLNDAQINEVVKEGLRIGTNMTAGNKAKWQDGILGLPTQFWQQTHKYYENLFYGMSNNKFGKDLGIVKENQWTMKESMTALAMNIVGFGAAGYGLDEFVSSFDSWLTDPEGLGLDPEKDKMAIATLRGGLLEMFMLEATGVEVDIADRTAPANGAFLLYEKIYKPLSEAGMEGKLPEGIGKVLFGATGTSLGRIYDAGKSFATLMVADSRNMDWDLATVLGTAESLAQVTSSMTNVERALAWQSANDILNTRGLPLNIVEDGTEIPTAVVLLKAFGFDPLAKEKMEKLLREDKMREKDKEALVQSLTADYRSYLSNPEDGTIVDETQQTLISRRLAMRKDKLLETYGETTTNEIMTRVIDTLNKESLQYGYSDFQKKLFEATLKATQESDLEKELRRSLELSRTVAKIKGTQVDAD